MREGNTSVRDSENCFKMAEIDSAIKQVFTQSVFVFMRGITLAPGFTTPNRVLFKHVVLDCNRLTFHPLLLMAVLRCYFIS